MTCRGLAVAIVLSGPVSPCVGATLGLDTATPDAAQKRWNDALVQNYEFTRHHSAFISFCPLLHGRVIKGVPTRRLHCRDLQGDFSSVPMLFDYLREALTNDVRSVAVKFDPTYGFPAEVHIEWSGALDDFDGFEVSGFRLLK